MIKTNREKSILVFLFLFYSVLQFFVLGKRGLDGDEGVILKVALATDWQSFWAFIANDVHPPLYHLLARVSMNIFGAHEWSLRLPAALAGALLIPLGYFLGKNIFNKKSLALLLATLFTLSPYLFYFHNEARFYSLLLLGATLTYIAILRMQSGKNVWWWILFFLGALTMVWTHYLGWFLLGVEICALIVARQWQVARRIGTALFLLLLSYIPFYTIAVTQISGRLTEQGGFTLGENIQGVFGALYRFGTGRLILGVEPETLLSGGSANILLFTVSLFVPVIIIVAGWQLQKKHTSLARQNFSIIVAIVLSSIIMALLVSEVGGRATRYLIYLWPFYGIFIVLGIMSIW
ncbi:glycosyltransferase family 39 protein, partial [Patescibacteria group bacterium]|nr:glycosyltransferase family 39 protein [Patescibacteria group bacterium]